jgi:hypothetical protein
VPPGDVGPFLSYARLVPGRHESAGKSKGSPNAKIGNAHLKWAFSEAACLLVRHSERGKRWLARRTKKHGKAAALAHLAAKIGRTVYHLWRKGEVYDENVCSPADAVTTYCQRRGWWSREQHFFLPRGTPTVPVMGAPRGRKKCWEEQGGQYDTLGRVAGARRLTRAPQGRTLVSRSTSGTLIPQHRAASSFPALPVGLDRRPTELVPCDEYQETRGPVGSCPRAELTTN